MTNYIIIWERDESEGFCFVYAEDEDSAIEQFLKEQNGPHPNGRLHKMIITETNKTYKVPLDIYGYYYNKSPELDELVSSWLIEQVEQIRYAIKEVYEHGNMDWVSKLPDLSDKVSYEEFIDRLNELSCELSNQGT